MVNLKDKLRELTETHDLVLKHGHTMLRQLAELDNDQLLPGAIAKVKEKVALFKLTTGAMMKVNNNQKFLYINIMCEAQFFELFQMTQYIPLLLKMKYCCHLIGSNL